MTKSRAVKKSKSTCVSCGKHNVHVGHCFCGKEPECILKELKFRKQRILTIEKYLKTHPKEKLSSVCRKQCDISTGTYYADKQSFRFVMLLLDKYKEDATSLHKSICAIVKELNSITKAIG